MKIEDRHKENFKRIKQHKIASGQTWKNKKTGEIVRIDYIHALYGWTVSEPYAIKQDLENIEEFEILKPVATW